MTNELIEAKAAQLSTLQSRLNIHGNKLWQLPFSYLGAVLLVISLVQKEGLAVDPSLIFCFVAIAGLVVLWCMYGAYEGYSRTVEAINELERDLGLVPYARNYPSHSYPYFSLMIISVIALFGAAFTGMEISGESQIVATGEGRVDTTTVQTTMDAWEFYISVLTPLISAVTLAVLVGIFWYDRRRNKSEGTYNHNLAWQGFNQIFTDKIAFVDFERKLHPFYNLSREDMLRVYYWFMRLNVVYRAHRSRKHKTMGWKLGESSLANEINISFGDQDFIRRNVFTRGYDHEFAQTFEAGWKKIAADKKTLAMTGAPESSRVPPIYNADFSSTEHDPLEVELLRDIGDPTQPEKERHALLTKLIKHQAASKTDDAKRAATAE